MNKAEANLIYDDIVTALQSKYGEAYSLESRPESMQTRDATWLNGRVDISATLLAFDDSFSSKPLVQIAYQTKVAESSDSL